MTKIISTSIKKSDPSKKVINIVIIGHANSGKSTMIGHLLRKLQCIDNNIYQQAEKAAEQIGKRISIQIKETFFETSQHYFTVIDTPGNKKFTKNAITGISQANATIMMIDATPENFEAGISQTQEYALISLFFNIKQKVVVDNKMDDETVNFSQIRFNEIKNEMTKILVEIGYKPDQYQFVPASGFSGDNLIEKSSNLSWWTGKTLLETLDAINESVQQNNEKALRFLIRKVFNVSGVGTVVTGSVASGMMKPGMRVTFPLSNITSEVKSIEMFHTKIDEAVPYNIVGVCIDEDASSIVKRDVCGEANRNRPLECIGFTAKLMIKNYPGKIYVGYEPILYCRAGRVQCKFEKFIQRINRYHGNKVIENPEWIQKDDAAVVDIRLSKSIFVEPFKEFNNLGSFVLRDNNQTVAVGFILIVDKKPHFLKKRHNVTPVW